MCLFMLEVGRDCFAARASGITLALVTRKIDCYKFMPFSFNRCLPKVSLMKGTSFFLPSIFLSLGPSFLPPSLFIHDGDGAFNVY